MILTSTNLNRLCIHKSNLSSLQQLPKLHHFCSIGISQYLMIILRVIFHLVGKIFVQSQCRVLPPPRCPARSDEIRSSGNYCILCFPLSCYILCHLYVRWGLHSFDCRSSESMFRQDPPHSLYINALTGGESRQYFMYIE